MEFTEKDREELYQVWMTKKAKMHLMQMEVAKQLGVSQKAFSELLRGDAPLTMNFIKQFCQIMHIEPKQAIASLRNGAAQETQIVLNTRIAVDGEVQRLYLEGNDVVIEYVHQLD